MSPSEFQKLKKEDAGLKSTDSSCMDIILTFMNRIFSCHFISGNEQSFDYGNFPVLTITEKND